MTMEVSPYGAYKGLLVPTLINEPDVQITGWFIVITNTLYKPKGGIPLEYIYVPPAHNFDIPEYVTSLLWQPHTFQDTYPRHRVLNEFITGEYNTCLEIMRNTKRMIRYQQPVEGL